MTRTIGGPSRLSQVGNGDIETGGIRRIHGLENNGAGSPQNSTEKKKKKKKSKRLYKIL